GRPLQQRQGVTEDEAGLIDVIARASVGAVTQLHAEVFQRALLEHVTDVGIALPLAAIAPAWTVETIAAQVARHEAQPRNAYGSKVVVVAQLPRLLAGTGEVGRNHHVVDQVGIGPIDVRKASLAAHLLVRRAKGVA